MLAPMANSIEMDDLPKLSDLAAATDLARLEFLRADLGLCFTFANLAETERGLEETAAAERILEKAELGYASIERFSADIKDEAKRREIEQKLGELRKRLDGLRR
jgi:hypothetical protein